MDQLAVPKHTTCNTSALRPLHNKKKMQSASVSYSKNIKTIVRTCSQPVLCLYILAQTRPQGVSSRERCSLRRGIGNDV